MWIVGDPRICFYFEPICPWCHQTSRWARRLEELGVVDIDWALFSLELHPSTAHRVAAS